MTAYKNLSGKSGITAYAIGDDYIDVEFNSGGVYRYTEASVGEVHFNVMKALAIAGAGLNAFINKHVRFKYANHRPKPTAAQNQINSINRKVSPAEAVAIIKELLEIVNV